jgi:hypothetical protein
MGHRLFILSVMVLATGASVWAGDVPGRYVWPIANYTNLSAGFCDFRTRHYHGGIDVSTNGQEGLEVRAADSGWVERVSVGYWGYGKAVYLHLADGRMAVYGHLSELGDKIREYVEAEQYKTQRYQQNLYPPPGHLPIARGEVIAYSGQTGAGPPHLHFEIRTGDNKPLNPLAFFDKTDKIKPSLYSVTITPIQPSDLETPPSTVGGSLLPKTYSLQKGKLTASPTVSGTVGISILADDNIDAPRWTMSAYSHRLLVNGVEIGEVRYDSINYDHTRQIEIERQYDPDGGLSPRAVNLFRREHNILWHYHGFRDDGILSAATGLKPGKNEVRIEVADRGGHENSVTFTLELADSAGSASLPETPTEITTIPVWGGAVILAPVSSTAPDLSLDADGDRPIRHWLKGKDGWQAWLPASAGVDRLWQSRGADLPRQPVPLGWRPIRSEDGGLVASEDGRASVTLAAGDLYTAGFWALRRGEPGPKSRALTPLYTLAPRDIPLARDARLQIDLPRTDIALEKLAIYRAGGGWSFEGRQIDTLHRALAATIRSAGTFAILADRTAPVIAKVTPTGESSLKERRPTIRFEVSDNLSGIGSDEDLRLTVDGQWVPVEYDPDLRAAKARPRWTLDPGTHTVEIVARDRCGNEARFTRTLTIRK